MTSPTQRSLKWLRDAGYMAEVVEKWIPGANIRKDFAGFVDIIGIHKETGSVRCVQSTSASNVSSRVTKILDSENLPLLRKANMEIFVHGWRLSKGRWVLREVDLS